MTIDHDIDGINQLFLSRNYTLENSRPYHASNLANQEFLLKCHELALESQNETKFQNELFTHAQKLQRGMILT